MKINLVVRMKNPVFWLTIIPALTACVYTILGSVGIVPAISENEIVNAFSNLITILATLGVLVDPTTSGASDSERAMTYTKPQ